jgi:hypothetical protein
MYKFHKDRGLLNDEGNQILQLVKTHCSEKERVRLGKLLAEALNLEKVRKEVAKAPDWDVQFKLPKSLRTIKKLGIK